MRHCATLRSDLEINFSKFEGAHRREVRVDQRRGASVRVVALHRNFPFDQRALWDALTLAECLSDWFTPISGDLRPGGRFQLEGNASGTIELCQPPARIGVTWEFGGNVSWVEAELAHSAAGTALRLEHSMTLDDASEEHWRKFGPGATGVGWDMSLVGLAAHLDPGCPSEVRKAGEGWLGTEGGKGFIRHCAGKWYEAHIASGESREIAKTMADNTAAAYSGE